MTLDRNNIIQVNVIIITGLLILLSLQSLSSPIYDTTVVDSLNRMADDGIEYNKINDLYNKYCSKSTDLTFTFLDSTDVNEMCKKLEIEKIEIDTHGDVLYKYLESFSILKDNKVTTNAWITIWGPYYAKMITIIIMIPFIISTLIEIKTKHDVNELNNEVSKWSLILFSFGMVFLLVGVVLIMLMIYYTAPWQNLVIRPPLS